MSPSQKKRILILPPPVEAHTGVLVADGTRRARGGLSGGRHAIIRAARWGAKRDGLHTLVLCVLSVSNVLRRSDVWAASFYRQIVELAVDMDTDKLLTGDGIALGLSGDVPWLLSRGGVWSRVAEGLLALVRCADTPVKPRLRLLLAVAYPDDLVSQLDAQIVIRTGMEQDDLVRLSGIDHGGAVVAGTSTLFPDLHVEELERLWTSAQQCAPCRHAPGITPLLAGQLIAALAEEDTAVPMLVTVPVDAGPSQVATLAHSCSGRSLSELRPSAPWMVAAGPHQIVLVPVGAGWGDTQSFDAVIAPGQQTSAIQFPAKFHVGQAAVHSAGTSAVEIRDALLSAARFRQKFPRLLGAERSMSDASWLGGWPARILENLQLLAEDPDTDLTELASRRCEGWLGPERRASLEVELASARFLHCVLNDEERCALVPPDEARRRAVVNYVYTAFLATYLMPSASAPDGSEWEKRGALFALAMLAVAAADEQIFDLWLAEDDAQTHFMRIQRAEQTLRHQLTGVSSSDSDDPAIAAIVATWLHIFHLGASAGHNQLLDDLRCAVLATNRANVQDWLPSPRLILDEAEQRVGSVHREGSQDLPTSVMERLRELEELARHGNPSALSELHVLLWLLEQACTVAAGVTFRALALDEPAHEVNDVMRRGLAKVAIIADCCFRLANDLSGYAGTPGGDRDGKENAWTILVPPALAPDKHEDAVIAAVGICRQLLVWLEDAYQQALAELAESWPTMATVVARASYVGREVYGRSHFASLNVNDILHLLHELDLRYPYQRSR